MPVCCPSLLSPILILPWRSLCSSPEDGPKESTFTPFEVKEEELVANSVEQVNNLLQSPALLSVLADVEKYANVKKDALSDNDPEYDLIVRCNELSITITHSIADIHKVCTCIGQ